MKLRYQILCHEQSGFIQIENKITGKKFNIYFKELLTRKDLLRGLSPADGFILGRFFSVFLR